MVGLLSVLLMLTVPKTFESHATVHSIGGSENTGLLGMLSGLSGGISANQNETGFLISILNSRTLLMDVIDEFNFIELYDVELKTEAYLAIKENYNIIINDEGAIELTFSHRTGWLSTEEEELRVKEKTQEVLQFIVDYLDRTNVALKTQNAKYQREFLEGRYDKEISAIDSLQSFNVEYREMMGVISIENQIEGKMQIIVELQKQLIEIETQLYVAEKTLSPDSPKIEQLLVQKAAVLLQMDSHEKAYESRDGNDFSGLFPPLKMIPSISLTIMRQVYELEANSKLLEYLAAQLEEAKLREAKDTPTIQVIDSPYVPEVRSAPQRGLTVIITCILAFLAILGCLFIYEEMNSVKYSPEIEKELKELSKHYNLLTGFLKKVNGTE